MLTNKEIAQRVKNTQVTDLTIQAGFHKASGLFLEDAEGNRYMDFSGGFGVVNIGWQHPIMLQAMKRQISKSTFAPPWMTSEESALLGEKLIGLTGNPDFRCLRATGGGDANEILLKALYAHHQGDVLTFDRSYHGGTHATIGMGEEASFRLPLVKQEYRTFKIPPPYCFRCSWKKSRQFCSLECALAVNEVLEKEKSIKTLFAEPVLGSGGVIIPPEGYFNMVREICNNHDVALIFDEVMTGFGRTGRMFAHQKMGVQIEGMSLAKGMSSGYAAIGAAMLKNHLLESYRKFDDVSATFAWTPLACRVALTNIRIIEADKLTENAVRQGEYLSQQLRAIFTRYAEQQLGEIRSCGLMIGVEWVNNQSEKKPNPRQTMKFMLRMFHKGLMWCASWDYHTMIALPPLVITRNECDEALNIIEDTAKETFGKSNH